MNNPAEFSKTAVVALILYALTFVWVAFKFMESGEPGGIIAGLAVLGFVGYSAHRAIKENK